MKRRVAGLVTALFCVVPSLAVPLSSAARAGGCADTPYLFEEQPHSVVRASNPHGDTKVSSAHGLTQEQLGETLAEGHPGSSRPIAKTRH